ncbi:Ubp5-interacting protein [Lasiodiplodia theobromae]|uniref:Ubp5-interacting protein n=1 Tax=Lasiodiplodia theobromae TaxID=45133 RepID=A0A5N5DJY9_9PEZI|nr:Ubp5-interacting protein [Lasiodiplodia theobromae]
MGASDSKLVFKQGIIRLAEQTEIPADDTYWTGFWELPESAEDVFTLFSPADIRRTRDNALANLETLVLAVSSRLCVLRNHPSFPDPELAPERDALNCIRVLTRLLPYIYEADHLDAWEDKFFWGARRKRSRKGQLHRSEVLFDGANAEEPPKENAQDFEEVKPLAEELIDTLIDLLFFADFTLPKGQPGKGKVTYAIWQSGVGCNTPVGTSKEFENNRTEILRLLLTLASKSMYTSPNVLPVKGVKAITYITTCPDKQIVLSLLCSLLNTTLKYNPASWRVPYDHVVFKDPRQILVTYCLQFLLVLILYPIPEPGNGPPPKNFFRHFLGRLHRPQDFQFLHDGLTRILNQPLQATTSYLPGSQKSLTWAPEMLVLFWEALQCNKRFRTFIIDTDRAHDFVVLILFYAIDQCNDPSRQGLIRMCIFILQTLSTEPNFGKNLNKKFEGQETLPASIRIPNFHGTYADYLITSIYTLLTTRRGKLDAVYPALLAIVNNVAAYVQNLGRATSSKLIQLFISMSSPSFLLANESNHSLLHSLLEALNAIIEHQYPANPNLIYAILRQNSTSSLSSLATPTVMSNGKFNPTTEWLESWVPELPLHTILTLISQLGPLVPADSSADTAAALETIRNTEVRGIDPSAIRVHLFEWSPLSLGWYESLLWSFIFASEMLVSKGTAGVWNGTSIKLFRVQEVGPQTPSLLAPRGAVDAVGDNLRQRIGSLNLGRTSMQGGGSGAGGGAQSPGGGGNGPVRDI